MKRKTFRAAVSADTLSPAGAFLSSPCLKSGVSKKRGRDDCIRLFGAGQAPETYAAHFLALGAQQVVLTMGSAGVLLANATGISYYPTHQGEVVDVTGAGDSFWASLLVATLDGYAMPEAIRVAQAVAAIKVRQVGPLSQMIDRAALYAHVGLQKEDI